MRYALIFFLLAATNLSAQMTNQNVMKFLNFHIFLSEAGFLSEEKPLQAGKKKEEKVIKATNAFKPIKTKKTNAAVKKREVSLSEEDQLFQTAKGLFQEGNYRESEDIFIDLLQRFPDTKLKFETTYYLAELKLNTGRLDEAMMYYSKIIQDYPDSDYAAPAYYRIGYIYFRNNDYTNSLKFLSLLGQKYGNKPVAPESYLLKAKVYIALRQYRNAITACETIIKKYPNSNSMDDAYFSLADLYQTEPEIRDMEKARDNFQKVVDQYPDSPYCEQARQKVRFIKENFLEYK
ncbi:MAG: tetratricopeptide repeat protein [bacterium]|nr:tetratricopeptide repeat protein [bacterium]